MNNNYFVLILKRMRQLAQRQHAVFGSENTTKYEAPVVTTTPPYIEKLAVQHWPHPLASPRLHTHRNGETMRHQGSKTRMLNSTKTETTAKQATAPGHVLVGRVGARPNKPCR